MALLRLLPLLLLALHALAGAPSMPHKEAALKKRHGHGRHHYFPHRYAHGLVFDREKPDEPRGMIEIPPPEEFEPDREVPHEPPHQEDSFRDDGEEPLDEAKPSEPAGNNEGTTPSEESENSSYRCPSATCTADLELSQEIRVRQVQAQILKETGIKTLPNMTGFVLPQNPYLQRIIYSVNEQIHDIDYSHKRSHHNVLGDDPNIRSEKVFLTASKGPSWVKIPDGHKLHYFNLSREHSSSIAMANVHIWLKPLSDSSSKDKVAQITILKVEPSKFPQDYNRLRSINNDITVPYSAHGIWAKVDVFYLVRQWLLNIEDNLGFVVTVSTVDGIMVDVDTAEDDPSHAPLLELDVREERNDRRKRFANNRICSDKKIERECCRYPLTINFLKYRFDFIVAPKKYVANYCRGECPFLYAHKVPHSTLLQQMFPNTTTSNHGPCCGARVLEPLKMVYYDGHKIKIGIINDMVVKQCSCT